MPNVYFSSAPSIFPPLFQRSLSIFRSQFVEQSRHKPELKHPQMEMHSLYLTAGSWRVPHWCWRSKDNEDLLPRQFCSFNPRETINCEGQYHREPPFLHIRQGLWMYYLTMVWFTEALLLSTFHTLLQMAGPPLLHPDPFFHSQHRLLDPKEPCVISPLSSLTS